MKAIQNSLTAAEKYEEGPRLERTGIWSSLIHPRIIPWALLSLALSASTLFGVYYIIKKTRSGY